MIKLVFVIVSVYFFRKIYLSYRHLKSVGEGHYENNDPTRRTGPTSKRRDTDSNAKTFEADYTIIKED